MLPRLRRWLAHHAALGVRRAVIYSTELSLSKTGDGVAGFISSTASQLRLTVDLVDLTSLHDYPGQYADDAPPTQTHTLQ